MNRHFEDTRYYVKRAGETAKKGVSEELEPVERRVKKLVGKEAEPEPGRVEEVRMELKELQGRAKGETKEAIREARKRLQTVREQRAQ
ncbi:DUF7553 family protein [Salinibaculum salinum]|uniref:DUF7553 family protein n=1 Tax=Salinibaculum salinum TaxID=3131996 RepID=UPI0030ECAF63